MRGKVAEEAHANTYTYTWNGLYGMAGISPHYPLKTLYTLHLLRRRGVGADIVKKKTPIKNTPTLLIRIYNRYVSNKYVDVLIKPRKDLEIKYPHQQKQNKETS